MMPLFLQDEWIKHKIKKSKIPDFTKGRSLKILLIIAIVFNK